MSVLFRIGFFCLLTGCVKQEATDSENMHTEKSYRSDGRIYAEISYRDDKPHGIWKIYHLNEKLYVETEYRDGIVHGLSKQYYQSGVLYSETPYVDGSIDGVVKKYHKDGKLKAEIPYKDDFPCLGLKEYILSGEPRPHYPDIIITPENSILTQSQYLLYISLSERVQEARFFIGELSKGCLHDGLQEITPTGKDTGVVSVNVQPGESINGRINIIARIQTIAGNVLIVQQPHTLKIDFY